MCPTNIAAYSQAGIDQHPRTVLPRIPLQGVNGSEEYAELA